MLLLRTITSIATAGCVALASTVTPGFRAAAADYRPDLIKAPPMRDDPPHCLMDYLEVMDNLKGALPPGETDAWIEATKDVCSKGFPSTYNSRLFSAEQHHCVTALMVTLLHEYQSRVSQR